MAATEITHPYQRRPRILLGITGSVAAVKGPKLALRLANELKADVKVILTRTVEEYFWKDGRAVQLYDDDSWRELKRVATISPPLVVVNDNGIDEDWRLSSGSISIHYAEEEWSNYKNLQDNVLHIDIRNWADLCLIAPLSAHTLSKIANGLCDDLLSCCLRAWDFSGQRRPSVGIDDKKLNLGKPVILCPAMNTAMWDHPLTRLQLDTITKFPLAGEMNDAKEDKNNTQRDENGVIVVEPAVKTLACGEIGAGALADLDDIISVVRKCLIQWDVNKDPTGKETKANDSSSRKEAMKRALLLYAKQRFNEMKSSHNQQQSTTDEPESSSSKLAAPISPTPNLIIEAFLPRLNLDSNSLLVDLGCGDGRWLIAANKYTQCKCLGIDVDEERLRIAREAIIENNLQGMVQVHKQDVFEFMKKSDDFGKVDVIIMYLFREAMTEMGTILQQRLDVRDRDGASSNNTEGKQILCVGFSLPGWTSMHEEKVNGVRVYLYSTKVKA